MAQLNDSEGNRIYKNYIFEKTFLSPVSIIVETEVLKKNNLIFCPYLTIEDKFWRELLRLKLGFDREQLTGEFYDTADVKDNRICYYAMDST